MNKEILEKYASLKQVISDAEGEIDVLKPQVLEMMNNVDTIEIDSGTFNIIKRRTWIYPGPLVEREKQLKIDQKLSQQLGTSSYTEAPILVYKELKKDAI